MPLLYMAAGGALAWIVGDTADRTRNMAIAVGAVGLGYYLFVRK